MDCAGANRPVFPKRLFHSASPMLWNALGATRARTGPSLPRSSNAPAGALQGGLITMRPPSQPTAKALAVPGPNEYSYVKIGVSASTITQPCGVLSMKRGQNLQDVEPSAMFEGYSEPEVGVNRLFRDASAKATLGGARTSTLGSAVRSCMVLAGSGPDTSLAANSGTRALFRYRTFRHIGTAPCAQNLALCSSDQRQSKRKRGELARHARTFHGADAECSKKACTLQRVRYGVVGLRDNRV